MLLLAKVGVLLVAWLAYGLLARWYWSEGVVGLQRVLEADVARVSRLAERQGWTQDVAASVSNALYWIVFEATGIHGMAVRFSQGAPLSIPDTVVRTFFERHWAEFELMMWGTHLVGVRAAALLIASPTILAGYALGAAEGWVERAHRRKAGGAESSNLYHRAKYAQVVWVLGMTVVVVLWPMPIDPEHVGLGMATVLGLAARTQWVYYKKHL